MIELIFYYGLIFFAMGVSHHHSLFVGSLEPAISCVLLYLFVRNFCKHSHLLALLKVIPSGIEKSSDVDLRSKQQEVVDGMGCVPSPSCGETKEDDDLGDIIEPEKLPKEYEDFLARIQHLKRFMNSPENSLASKKAIASQLETVPLREIQLTMNP
ncbi:hypothetical protein TCAL_15414, partial [Tigriopus californicus]